LHQLLLRHVAQKRLKIGPAGIAETLEISQTTHAAATAARSGSRRVVQQVVDLFGEFGILVGFWLLHPEKELPGGGLELEHIDTVATSGADSCRGDMFEIDVIGEDDQIVHDFSRGPIFPAEVHQGVVRLVDVNQSLALVRRDQIAGVLGQLASFEFHEVLAVGTRRRSSAKQRHSEKCLFRARYMKN